jgi:AcrR family transcriptional regulator
MNMSAVDKKTKWQVKREASRAAILDAAMRCFHDRGYAATTVADIVAGTDYTSGAFYFHFKDKAECFWEVVDRREARRGAWWDSALEGLDPKTDRLEDVLERVFGHFDEALEGVDHWVLTMVDFHQQHGSEPEVRERLAGVYARWQAELRQFLTSLAERGWIPPERAGAGVAVQIFAFGEGMATHGRLYGLDREAEREALVDGLVRLLR